MQRFRNSSHHWWHRENILFRCFVARCGRQIQALLPELGHESFSLPPIPGANRLWFLVAHNDWTPISQFLYKVKKFRVLSRTGREPASETLHLSLGNC